MTLFRSTLLATALVGSLAACNQNETAPADSNVTDAANVAQAAVERANVVADTAPAETGEAAELDVQLAALEWGGVAATTWSYAEACGAEEAKLARSKETQRAQVVQMGTDPATFDRQFEEALPLAVRRVGIDDVSMAASRRAGTCETVLAYLR